MRYFSFFSIFSVLIPALSVSLTGCKDVRIDAGTDMKFLHAPEELFVAIVAPTKPLFPDKTGTKWTSKMTSKDIETDEQTLVGKRMVSGVECLVIASIRNIRELREEMYVLNAKGIYQRGARGKEMFTMQPPIPILTFPLEAGKVIEWQGGISFPKGMVPGRAWSSVRGIEKIKVPAGSFDAYRTDTTLEANIDNRLTLFATTRWFVPGIGIAKTRYSVRSAGQPELEFRRELVRYTPAP